MQSVGVQAAESSHLIDDLVTLEELKMDYSTRHSTSLCRVGDTVSV